MVKQSGFAGGEVVKKFPDLKYGTDYDFFAVPGAQGLQGGADWMMAFSDKPAVKALVAYLSSTEGGMNWAKASFGVSPNKGANGNYTDPALVKLGDAMANTKGFTPDIGDTIPGGFGKAEWTAIINVVNGKDHPGRARRSCQSAGRSSQEVNRSCNVKYCKFGHRVV